jgi:DNA-binding MarR family transcriptional regulator
MCHMQNSTAHRLSDRGQPTQRFPSDPPTCRVQHLYTAYVNPEHDSQQDLTEALLIASRALVGVAARSLAALDTEVTLPQYRAMVVLAANGPQRVGDLAETLTIHPSTATRLCDRLVERDLIERSVDPTNRRETDISLSILGRAIVDRVTSARRAEIGTIVQRIPHTLQQPAITALRAFADAAGESHQEAWTLGWS